MNIKEKIQLDRKGLEEFGPINVVIFGDSVSHGAVRGYFDYENVYWNILKKKLNAFRDYMPVNMINLSVGGTTAMHSLNRFDKQVFTHQPDLVILCFGLNDVNGALSDYLDSLKYMFEKCKNAGCDTIFLTPNMLNTYVAEDTLEHLKHYAGVTAGFQNNGKMDEFIYSAIKLASEMGVSVCDCYSKWKKLSEETDITMLLANRINHPTSEMHNLFADALYELIMGKADEASERESSMYKEK